LDVAFLAVGFFFDCGTTEPPLPRSLNLCPAL
jgi:hypothetical protein